MTDTGEWSLRALHSDDIQKLRFYQTTPHECSYLPDREARTVFLDPALALSKTLYSRMITAGFRRSGSHLYRPACDACKACLSCRVQVRNFTRSSSYKRIWRRNADLSSKELPSVEGPEFYALYCRYIEARHVDGDMYPPTREQYNSFIGSKSDTTRYYAFYEGSKLLALSVTDELDHALSAMYTFFDPDSPRRSLGTYIILWQIEKAWRLNLPYVYLGYWIQECEKMRYKTKFRPLELLVDNRWLELSE